MSRTRPKSPWSNVTGIQWDGKFFAIDHTAVYRFSLIHGQAYNVGQTSLSFGGAAERAFWIYNNTPIGREPKCSPARATEALAG